jgi:hypothetical protein
VVHPHTFTAPRYEGGRPYYPEYDPRGPYGGPPAPPQCLCLVILMIVPMTAAAQRRFLVLVRTCREGDPDLPPLVCLPEVAMTMIVQGSNLTNWAGLKPFCGTNVLIDRHV